MTNTMLAACLLSASSLVSAAQRPYEFFLNEAPGFNLSSGVLDSLEVCDRGLCGQFVVGAFGFPATVTGEAYNISFSGLTPSGFFGRGSQELVSPVLVAGYGRGLSYFTSSFEALGSQYTYSFSSYLLVNGAVLFPSSGVSAGNIFFMQVAPVPQPIPEPESLALILVGLPAIYLARRKAKHGRAAAPLNFAG